MSRAFWVRMTLPAFAAGLLIAQPASALDLKLGAGVFGGYGIPVVQEDAGSGGLFGADVTADIIGPLGAEVFYMSFQEGDVTFDVPLGSQSIQGGTQNAFGLNAILRTNFGLYFNGGVGSYTLVKEHRPDMTNFGYNGGIGYQFRLTSGFAVDLAGRLHAVVLDDGGTRKFVGLQAGVNYYFLR
jgi:hypothetical protein